MKSAWMTTVCLAMLSRSCWMLSDCQSTWAWCTLSAINIGLTVSINSCLQKWEIVHIYTLESNRYIYLLPCDGVIYFDLINTRAIFSSFYHHLLKCNLGSS